MIVSNEITSDVRRVVWKTRGTCSQFINIDLAPDGRVLAVRFVGGCQGNTTGICSLVKGMKATEVKLRLKGINCGTRGTRSACPGTRSHEFLKETL